METSSSQSNNFSRIHDYVNHEFDKNLKPALMDYIRVPNLSRDYDPNWETNGYLHKAAQLMIDWGNNQSIKGMKIELLAEKSRTPMIFAEIDAYEGNQEGSKVKDEGSKANDQSSKGNNEGSTTILFYGHFDKQPHLTGWAEGLSPIDPVEIDGKLYGRGGADDGYAWYSAILMIKTIQACGLKHGRIVITIESDEESDSIDMPYYFDKLKDRIGTPSLIICTDSGCSNYEQLWLTTTLRGATSGIIQIKIANEGVHSGDASGIIPETFRILRVLLDRIEDPETGICHRDFWVNIPSNRYQEAEKVAKVLGDDIIKVLPFIPGARPVDSDPLVAYLNRIWRPALTITGCEDIPPTSIAGNVLRPQTRIKYSLRIPPTLDGEKAISTLKHLIEEKEAPYGAEVKLFVLDCGLGWNSPQNEACLEEYLNEASMEFYGKPTLYYGEGGSIPLMNFFTEKFPKAQFIVTGVLGPGSNAHGPNEFLHLPYTKKLIMCLTQVIAKCYGKLK